MRRGSFIFRAEIQRIAKGAGGKGPRQKTSKIVKKRQKVFRHFSTIFAQGKKRQKVSKSFSTLFDNFRAAPFFRPLLQSAEKYPPREFHQNLAPVLAIHLRNSMVFSKENYYQYCFLPALRPEAPATGVVKNQSSLSHKSGTQRKLFRKACSGELFYFGWIVLH